jgi:hypothetical protein
MAQKVSVHSCTVSHAACDLNRLIELRAVCIYPRAAPRILFRSSGRQVLYRREGKFLCKKAIVLAPNATILQPLYERDRWRTLSNIEPQSKKIISR